MANKETQKLVVDAINASVTGTGDKGHLRYKVVRTVAFQAFIDMVEADGIAALEELITKAVANSAEFPKGWDLGENKQAGVEHTATTPEVKPAVKNAASKKPSTASKIKRVARKEA